MSIPHICSANELEELIKDVGMLPFFSCEVPGFSVIDITDASAWWTGDPLHDPWEWRMALASGGQVVYSKLFHGKAGFVSLECFPDLANYRRDGYDFDALYEDGKAPQSSMDLMKLFLDGEGELPSYAIKKLSGVQKGFQGALTRLQMQTYLTICGFSRRKNKKLEEYGWHIAMLCMPERKFGSALVRSCYGKDPAHSLSDLVRRLSPYAGTDAEKLLRI